MLWLRTFIAFLTQDLCLVYNDKANTEIRKPKVHIDKSAASQSIVVYSATPLPHWGRINDKKKWKWEGCGG
jgi:hypothetical protein